MHDLKMRRGVRRDSMIRIAAVVVLSGWVTSLVRATTTPSPSEEQIRNAVTKTLPLIIQGANGHIRQRTCFACHHQALPVFALRAAQRVGLNEGEATLRDQTRFTFESLNRNRDNYRQGKGTGGQADTAGYGLWALETGGWKSDELTSAVTEYLLLREASNDHWGRTSQRPPSEASDFTTTYLALRGLRSFGTEAQKARIAARSGRARAWLLRAVAVDTEDRVFRLRALQLAGASESEVQAVAAELAGTQRDNGGWSQTADLSSDAYATGSALIALREAGLATTSPAYRRGLEFLLRTQQPDGSWYVKSRSKPFQEYFESGFPHGADQWISIAASCWAVVALAEALPPKG